MVAKHYIVDGLNVCKSYQDNTTSFRILLNLLVALRRNQATFTCLFDAITRYKLKEEDEDSAEAVRAYDELLATLPQMFTEVPGGIQADDFILLEAESSDADVISNDRYREYANKYEWLTPKTQRLVKGKVVAGYLVVPPLNMRLRINTDLKFLVGDLKRLGAVAFDDEKASKSEIHDKERIFPATDTPQQVIPLSQLLDYEDSSVVGAQVRASNLTVENQPTFKDANMQYLDHLWSRFAEAHSRSNWDAVIELGERILKINSDHRVNYPKIADVYFFRGRSFHQQKRYDKAISELTRAIELEPKPSYFTMRGCSHHCQGEYDHAIVDYTYAIQLEPRRSENYKGRAQSYLMAEGYDQTIADTRRAIEISADDAILYWQQARAWFCKGLSASDKALTDEAYDNAIADVDYAIKLDPTNGRYYELRGQILLFGKRDKIRAFSRFNRAIELDSSRADAYFLRASCYPEGLDKRKIEDYDQAIRWNPFASHYYYNRGVTYANLNKRRAARRDLKRAAELGHSDAKALLERF